MSKATTGNDAGGTVEPDAPGSAQSRLSPDEAFEVLSNRRRRYALHCLQRSSERRASLGEMSEQVAAWETDQDVDEVDGQARRRVYTSLQQFHLPKLDEKGVVEFDTDAGEVALGEAADDIDIYLEITEGRDLPWSAYYLGLAGVSALLVGLSWVGIPPFASVPDQGWLVFSVVTLSIFALAHTIVTRRMRLGSGSSPPELRR